MPWNGDLHIEMYEPPKTCERRREDEHWWICDYCGSLWTTALMGDWLPLSCVARIRSDGDTAP